MCYSFRGAHLSLIRSCIQFNGFHMDPKLSHMDPERMKRCPYPYLRENLLQWGEISKGTESEGNAVSVCQKKKKER